MQEPGELFHVRRECFRRQRTQRLDLAGEGEQRVAVDVVKRLDAEAVAGAEQALPLLIPDGEGEHADKAFQAGRPPGVISLKDHFGVAFGAKRVAERFQFLAQLEVVVDFAVERQPQLLARHCHWLVTGRREIEDRQAAVSERDVGRKRRGFVNLRVDNVGGCIRAVAQAVLAAGAVQQQETLAVRPAVPHQVGGFQEAARVHRLPVTPVRAQNSAHIRFSQTYLSGEAPDDLASSFIQEFCNYTLIPGRFKPENRPRLHRAGRGANPLELDVAKNPFLL